MLATRPREPTYELDAPTVREVCSRRRDSNVPSMIYRKGALGTHDGLAWHPATRQDRLRAQLRLRSGRRKVTTVFRLTSVVVALAFVSAASLCVPRSSQTSRTRLRTRQHSPACISHGRDMGGNPVRTSHAL